MNSPKPIFRRLFSRAPVELWEQCTDAQLVAAARVQDRAGKEAFVEVVRRHQNAVSAVAYGICGRLAVTEEIAQEVFLYAWQQMRTLREPARLKAWLTKIARSKAVDAASRDQRIGPLEDEIYRIPAPEPPPDAAAAAAEDERILWDALAELPENFRLPLVLFYQEDQSISAVGETLEISADAVKQRLSWGREALREKVAARMAVTAEARLAGMLRRDLPGPLLVVAIASAIGLFAPPAAVAAVAMKTTAPASTMSGAAAPWVATAAAFAVCIPLGWQVRSPREAGKGISIREKEPASRAAQPASPETALLSEWRRLHALHGSDAAAMPALHSAMLANADEYRREALLSALLAEWAEVDPEGGFLMLVGREKERAVQLARRWLAIAPERAAAFLSGQAAVHENAAAELLADMAAVAPESMVAAVRQMSAADRYGAAHPAFAGWKIRAAFAIYAATHSAAACEAAGSLAGLAARRYATGGAVEGWAAHAGKAALTWAQALTDEGVRDEAVRAALNGWAGADPLAALEYHDEIPPDLKGKWDHRAASELWRVASLRDFEGTLAWLLDHPDKAGKDAWRGMADTAVKRLLVDAPAILSLLMKQYAHVRIGITSAMPSAMTEEVYAVRGPIWEWIAAQPESQAVHDLKIGMIRAGMSHDPAQAIDWLSTLPDTPDVQRIVRERVGFSLTEAHFDAQIAQLPDGLRGALLAAQLEGDLSWTVPQTEQWKQRLDYLPDDARRSAVAYIAQHETGRDPALAVEWATSLERQEDQAFAIEHIAAKRAKSDTAAASEWVDSLPPGHARDAAAAGLAVVLVNTDAEAAWTWAESITDPARRAAVLADLEQTPENQ